VLSHALPPFHEMCERFARFITKSMYGFSALVQSVVMHSIHGTGFTSVINTTISTACNHFGWSPRDFIRGKVSVYDDNRLNHKFRQGLSDHENAVAEFVNEFVLLRDGYLHLPSYMCMSITEIASIVSI